MKRTKIITLILFASFFLSPATAHSQVLSEGQPSVLKEEQNPQNYVYDLKQLIKKSRDNIKNVDLKIKEQAVIKRNQKREEKAREYYEQAMQLQEEGRLEEARQIFEKAIRITDHPEMQGYIKESERRAKSQANALRKEEEDQERRLSEEERLAWEKAEEEYQVAVNLYRQQQFKEARTAFEVVEEMAPDYKAVRSYLQIIEQDIAQQDKLSLKEQKKEIERQQREEDVARLREKELWRKEIEQKEVERTKQLRKQAEQTYNEAVKLYQEKNYQAAKAKFQEVDWVVPDFKATRAYLGRVDQDIENDKRRIMSEREKELERQRWIETLAERKAEAERQKALQVKEKERLAQIKDQAEFLYGAAVALFDKNSYAQAKEKLDEVEALYPNYKLTRNYLSRAEKLLGLPPGEHNDAELETALSGRSPEEQKQILDEALARRQTEKDRVKKISVEAEDAFNEAMDLYKSGRLIEAKEKLIAVDQMIPDYKSARSVLKRIDEDIELLAKTHKREQVFLDQKAEIERLKALKEKADAMYAAALAAFDAKDFDRARSGFKEVEVTLPDFKKTNFYLQRIEEEIARQEESRRRKEIESQANIVYAQAVVLYNTAQFEEAKKKFIEVEALFPDYKDVSKYLEHIDDDIIAQKEKDLAHLKELQVEGPYREATLLYQSRDFIAAKSRFLEVMAVYPEYKDTALFLNRIDDDIERQRKETALRERTEQAETLYQQALELYQAGDFVSAKEKFVKLEVVWPDYKETPRYLGRIDGDIDLKRQKEDAARRASEAEPIYEQALALYKEQEFLEARKKFMQVQVISPGFSDTARYLSHIDRDVKNQEERVATLERSRRADELYTLALNLYAERRFEEAKQKLLETAAVDPNYKNLRSYLGRIDSDMRSEAARQERNSREQQAEEPYAQAVTLYHDRDFESAKEKFLETSRILPDYKKVRSYLARIDQDIREGKRKFEQERTAKAVALHREAQALLAEEKLAESFNKFSELEALYPDYKNTRTMLGDLGSRLGVAGPSGAGTAQPAGDDQGPDAGTSDAGILALYKKAVSDFKSKNYQEARTRFEQIASSHPNYRSTHKYLQSIEEILGTQKRPEDKAKAAQPPAAPQSQPKVAKVKDQLKGSKAKSKGTAPASGNEKEAQAGSLYSEGVQLYKAGKYDEAKAKFEQIEATVPDYKATRHYVSLVEQAKAKVSRTAVAPAPSEKELAALQVLSQRSEEIYRQIRELARDKDMASALQTFSQVDRIISQLESEQKRLQAQFEAQQRRESEELIRQKKAEKKAEISNIRRAESQKEQLKQAELKELADGKQVRLADIKAQEKNKEQQEQRAFDTRVEASYQKALEFYNNKKYSEARDTLSEIEAVRPNYKDCVRLLNRIDREEGEAKLVERENADRKKVMDLAERASAINLDIVQLTGTRDYGTVLKKFDELSQILEEVKNIKENMLARRREFANMWEKRMAQAKISGLVTQRSPEKFIADLDKGISASRARSVFREGERLYAAQKYDEAKVKFIEASSLDPHLKAAVTYLNRIRRVKEQKDFEARKAQIKVQKQAQEDRQLAKQDSPVEEKNKDEEKLAVAERCKSLRHQGLEFYRGKRYREARVKFEELLQIGDVKQRSQAARYLASIEKITQQEKTEADKKKKAERERYLRERMAQARLNDTGDVPPSAPSQQALTRGEREMEIQLQQNLRQIEQQNQAEREGSAGQADVKAAAAGAAAAEGPGGKESLPGQRTAVPEVRSAKVHSQRAHGAESPGRSDMSRMSPNDSTLSMAIEEEKRMLEEQRKAIRRDFEIGVDRLYNEAVELFKQRLYDEARQGFIQVADMIEGYKKTDSYLGQIDRILKVGHGHRPARISESIPRAPEAKADTLSADTRRKQAISWELDSFENKARP